MLNYIKKFGLVWLLALAMLFSTACEADVSDIISNIPKESQSSETHSPFESDAVFDTDGEITSGEETEEQSETERIGSVTILNGSEITLELGDSVALIINKSSFITESVQWSIDGTAVSVNQSGYVTAIEIGDATLTASAGAASDSIIIRVIEKTVETTAPVVTESETENETEPMGLPQVNEEQRDAFYGNSTPAQSNDEAIDRSDKGQLSGADFVPDQAPTISEYRPMIDGKYVRNKDMYYVDENTYIVVNAYGEEVFRVYRGGAYITLEEVAAYVYAFGDIPANYVSGKTVKPSSSIFGIYLRLNHTRFSGSTSKYPYEPMLPRISGCGGDLNYYEIDIGTTGTDCDPNYQITVYNNGTKITRGAARIVYTRHDANGNGEIDLDEIYVFYTYNHYNDFQEYLNYYGGWGEMFGNITGGGTLSSKTDYNPTPYVPVVMKSVRAMAQDKAEEISFESICYVAMILPEDLYYTRRF